MKPECTSERWRDHKCGMSEEAVRWEIGRDGGHEVASVAWLAWQTVIQMTTCLLEIDLCEIFADIK